MRHLSALLMLILAFTLVACAAPAPGNDTAIPEPMAAKPALDAATPAPTPPATADQNPPSAPIPARTKPAPPMSDPLPAQRMPDAKPTPRSPPIADRAPAATGPVDTSCKTAADCTVKNVGNCCGYYPACVNVNSPTDPAGVQAQCARSGMASVCGFKPVESCECVQGKCSAQMTTFEAQ